MNLHSVSYNINDMQKAKEWYGKVLHAVPVTYEPRFASFSTDGDRLGLNMADQPKQKQILVQLRTGRYQIFIVLL